MMNSDEDERAHDTGLSIKIVFFNYLSAVSLIDIYYSFKTNVIVCSLVLDTAQVKIRSLLYNITLKI